MTHTDLAARLRELARDKPTNIWWELHALAVELEQAAELDTDIEVTVRTPQPPAAPRRPVSPQPPEPPQTPLRLTVQAARNLALVMFLQLDGRLLDARSRRHVTTLAVLLLIGLGVAFAIAMGGTP